MKKYYTKEEFMNLCNINNRSRLHQILFGFNQKKGDKIYNIEPKLIEGEDFIKSDYLFFPSAIKKMQKNST